ncbi:MAG: hypothetical protein M0003_13090 [Acidithiobacillus sp.]|nr:hypothetical protein [Acidithiobacillus sp.]
MEKTIYPRLRNLLGEFMSDDDVAQLERYLQEEGALRAKTLMNGLSKDKAGVNAYRRGIQLCMRHAYWQADRMRLAEKTSMVDALGGAWVPPEDEDDMLYLAFDGKALAVVEPEHEDADLLMAMGFVRTLHSLRQFAVAA